MTAVPCVLVMGAGSGGANNLIRSIREAKEPIRVIGCHENSFLLWKSTADRNYLVPESYAPHFGSVLRELIAAEDVRLVIPTTDTHVRTLSDLRDKLSPCLFVPSPETVALCQDKYALTTHLALCDVAVPPTRDVRTLDDLAEIFQTLRPDPWLWCRARVGSGSLAALPVRTVEQAVAWIRYWEDMRGVPVASFTLAEYLPGRDFACQSIWRSGELVLLKTTERLSYFQGSAGPSGVSSIGAVHRTVYDPRIAELSAAAVFAVDSDACGAFSIDIKEDTQGRPCVTEINAGRFLTGATIFDATGQHNMTLTYVQLALGKMPRIDSVYDAAEGCYMVRDLDTLPDIFRPGNAGAEFVDVSRAPLG
jgi:carbamoyl-phosphate synthase large subunit